MSLPSPLTYVPIVVENLETWIIGQGGGATISPLILEEITFLKRLLASMPQ